MTESRHQMFRPPAEAGSVLIRVADGCPHNACAFCAMYRGVPHRVAERAEIRAAIHRAAAIAPDARRIFLADGDVMALPASELTFILHELGQAFPSLSRVGCYASGQAIAAKSARELHAFKEGKLHTVYMGLESGNAEVLRQMRKAETAEGMCQAVQRVQHAGICASVMVLVGLGGREGSARHVRDTIAIVNAMQPRLLSCLRVILVPGTPLARWIEAGTFDPVTEVEAVRELHAILSGLHVTRTVFRADHSSNILPLAGRLPRDRARLLAELEELLECGVLDANGPGVMPGAL